ncbi:MAG TPA: glycosyl hydrolase [Gaiellaceae bacterium]|nr:glycosyl hydrolase [Gaiellaceae bacterium]
MRVGALIALAFAFVVSSSHAAAQAPLLGIKGDAARFQTLTGQDSTVRHAIVGWGQGLTWGSQFQALLAQLGGVPMIGLSTRGRDGKEAVTPQQIALGAGDGYFASLADAASSFGQEIYIRPFGEMNGYWNDYCAYTKNGASKPGLETKWFRKAFARVYLIVHGGPAATINAKLKALGLPPWAGADIPDNPATVLHVVWNPQGFGAPNIPGNKAQQYYPGDAYVDVVGDDIYDQKGKAEWGAADALYKAHPGKPFSFPEWGLWGIDDPAFVKKMADFVLTHKRTEMLAYFESVPGSIFDLQTKPLSKAAYARYITPLG